MSEEVLTPEQLNPIPEGAVYGEEAVTQMMEVKGLPRDGAIGQLNGWASGMGELTAELVNGNPAFEGVVEAYYAAKGVEVPESVKVPLAPADEGVTDIMEDEQISEEVAEEVAREEAEKLPESQETAE